MYLDGHVHTYVHSIVHALERERSDDCSREKSTEEHFARTDLGDGVIGHFLHRSRERAIGLDGRKEPGISCLRDTKTWMSMYHILTILIDFLFT